MKFKVGDKVRVRKDLEVGERYGSNSFASSMEEMKGKIVTINLVDCGTYRIKDCCFWWTDEMFEPVENVITYQNKKYDVIKDIEKNNKRTLVMQEHKEDILDAKEKEYLSYVIRPFRKDIRYIYKDDNYRGEFIKITFNDGDYMSFKNFKEGTMYKDMELNKKYTIEELGL